MEASISGANHAVLHEPNHRCGLGHMETYNFGQKVPVLHAKTKCEVRDPWRLVLIMLFCMHQMTGEVWDP